MNKLKNMKCLITALVLFALVSCEKGAGIEYDTDICKINAYDTYVVYGTETEFNFNFGLNSFTNLSRIYMDSCSAEIIQTDLERAVFSLGEEVFDNISCDANGNITGDLLSAKVEFPLTYSGELTRDRIFFRFVLDNEASSDTVETNVYIR